MNAILRSLGSLLLLALLGGMSQAGNRINPADLPPPPPRVCAPDACGPGFYAPNCCGVMYGPNYCLHPCYPPYGGIPPYNYFNNNNSNNQPANFPTHPFARSPRDYFMLEN